MSDLTAAPAENPALPTKEVSPGMSHEVLPNVSEQVIEAAPEVSQVATKGTSTAVQTTTALSTKASKNHSQTTPHRVGSTKRTDQSGSASAFLLRAPSAYDQKILSQIFRG